MKHALILMLMALPNLTWAQSETANVTFNDGLIFDYDPVHFKLKIKFRMQGRATYEDFDSKSTTDDAIDFSVRRMRLRFEGSAVDPRFFYKFQLSFSRGDMDYDNNPYPNILRDAVIGWEFNDEHTIFIGQTKLPGNRQRVISSGNQEFVDRSLLNLNFNIDRDLGVQSWHRFFAERPLLVKLAITNGEGRASDNKDTGLASTGRIEWQPLGAFKGEGDYSEGDLEFETTPKLAMGATYSVNRRAHRSGGQTGTYFLNNESRDINTFLADALFKYQGWAVSSEFAQRKADSPYVNATQSILVGRAVTAQASYVFSNMLSPAIRFAKLWPDEQMYAVNDISTQYTAAITRYYEKHDIKLQADVTYEELRNPLRSIDQQNWIARFQFQLGI